MPSRTLSFSAVDAHFFHRTLLVGVAFLDAIQVDPAEFEETPETPGRPFRDQAPGHFYLRIMWSGSTSVQPHLGLIDPCFGCPGG